MARPYTPKVNRHVIYYTASGKPRPGTITGVTSNSVVDIRVGRAVVHVGKSKGPAAKLAIDSWRPK